MTDLDLARAHAATLSTSFELLSAQLGTMVIGIEKGNTIGIEKGNTVAQPLRRDGC